MQDLVVMFAVATFIPTKHCLEYLKLVSMYI